MNLYEALRESLPNDHCQQVNSIEIVKNYFENGNAPKNTLDFGCGTHKSVEFFNSILPDTKWAGIDIASSPIVNSSQDSEDHILTYDDSPLPFKNKSFDLIYSNQALEHTQKPNLALSEVARVITQEGLFIGQTSQFEPHHSLNLWNFTIYGFKQIIEKSGMKLLEIRPGIDGFTLMERSYTGDFSRYNKYFSVESPVNTKIEQVSHERLFSNKMINYKKLLYCGQFCFVCKLK